jgi:hypothetical protein
MARPKAPATPPESDPRFPSGDWSGFYLQGKSPFQKRMELVLAFTANQIKGTGKDYMGKFRIKGTYDLEDGRCEWTLSYYSLGSVHYKGFNEGKGIWGVWNMANMWRGGFLIWPAGMPDPTGGRMRPVTGVVTDLGFGPFKDDPADDEE